MFYEFPKDMFKIQWFGAACLKSCLFPLAAVVLSKGAWAEACFHQGLFSRVFWHVQSTKLQPVGSLKIQEQ